jgi:rhamnosyltransferase
MSDKSVCVVIPTYNGGKVLERCMEALASQGLIVKHVLIVDSSSSDGSIRCIDHFGYQLHTIESKDFDHGGTRSMALEYLSDCQYVIYLTQDAVLASPNALQTIVDYIDSNKLSVAYGRQLPSEGASVIAGHARVFNYPDKNYIMTKKDIPAKGLKAAYCSNSFAVYNKADLVSVGGFPTDLIFGEDMYIAAKLLLDDKSVGYCADAQVLHSHNYSFIQELKRYFDIGVFHSRERWLLENFGKVEGEGLKFLRSELHFLIGSKRYLAVIEMLFRTLIKYLGYKLGQNEAVLPVAVKSKISMNTKFWLRLKDE